jgi:hypothetical protein
MALSPGQVVRARVTRTAEPALFLGFRGHEIVIPLRDVSWTTCCLNCELFAEVGDEFDVKVFRWVEEKGVYLGGIRHAQPGSRLRPGPWQPAVGDVIRARVIRPVEVWYHTCYGGRQGYLIELRPAAYAIYCAEAGTRLAAGTELDVWVTNVSLRAHRVWVSGQGQGPC